LWHGHTFDIAAAQVSDFLDHFRRGSRQRKGAFLRKGVCPTLDRGFPQVCAAFENILKRGRVREKAWWCVPLTCE